MKKKIYNPSCQPEEASARISNCTQACAGLCDVATGHSQLSHESRILKKSILKLRQLRQRSFLLQALLPHFGRVVWRGGNTFQKLQGGTEWVTVIQMRIKKWGRTFSRCSRGKLKRTLFGHFTQVVYRPGQVDKIQLYCHHEQTISHE